MKSSQKERAAGELKGKSWKMYDNYAREDGERWEEAAKTKTKEKVRKKQSNQAGKLLQTQSEQPRLKHDKKFSIISTFILSSDLPHHFLYIPLLAFLLLFVVARRSSPILLRPMNIFEILERDSWMEAANAEWNGGKYEWMEAKLKAWSVVNYVMRIKLWLKISVGWEEKRSIKSPSKVVSSSSFCCDDDFRSFSSPQRFYYHPSRHAAPAMPRKTKQ